VIEQRKDAMYNTLINFMRKDYPDALEKAYEFFFEEENPEDFMMGTALELVFVNFEDWLLCDYRSKKGIGVMEMYLSNNDVDGEYREMLEAMKASVISLYEVSAVYGGLKLKDLLLEEEISFDKNPLPQLQAGSVFATRLIRLKGDNLLGRCVYPFSKRVEERLREDLDQNFKRYKKRKNPEGDLREFLKDEAYIFNTIWIAYLYSEQSGRRGQTKGRQDDGEISG
jgi:hypothetical protein